MYYFGFDMTYLVLVLPMVIFTLIAQARVTSVFNKYQKVLSGRMIPGAAAAREILRSHGLSDVRVNAVGGKLSDHYDPRDNTVNLSGEVYNGVSVASIGVAAHECGHAIQHAEGYGPVKLRAAIIPVTQLASKLAFPLIIAGFIFQILDLAYLGIAAFGFAVFFQLVTLPVEFDASKRALSELSSCGILTEDELKGTKKVLSAAAMTYVASLALSLVQLLRLILIVQGGNKRR